MKNGSIFKKKNLKLIYMLYGSQLNYSYCF